MKVTGVQGNIEFDGEWITITKTAVGQTAREYRLRASDVTGTRMRPGSWLVHGYVQFVLPGSPLAGESRGLATGGRPPHSDPHSLSIRRRSNAAASDLMRAVEATRRN